MFLATGDFNKLKGQPPGNDVPMVSTPQDQLPVVELWVPRTAVGSDSRQAE
jgi:hypothetical protein